MDSMRISLAILVLILGAPCASAQSADTPPAATEPVFCAEVYIPVCGVKDGKAATYSNDCFAHGAGAKVIHTGKCDASDASGGAKPQ
jgi:hypothetical protein